MRHALAIILGLASGITISGAVFAFLATIGIVTSLASRTHTGRHVKKYEMAIICGGILGCLIMIFDFQLPSPRWLVAGLSLLTGMFFGTLAMSLAETLDVLPILTRRLKINRGLDWMILAIAGGKIAGGILYFLIEGFHKAD